MNSNGEEMGALDSPHTPQSDIYTPCCPNFKTKNYVCTYTIHTHITPLIPHS